MNDTTRDELLTQVKTYLADFQDTTGYDNHDMNALGDTYAKSIIALVTAARDAEIREAIRENSEPHGDLYLVNISKIIPEKTP